MMMPASRWNFINFQTPSYSALMMEFTTPPSYGSTTVNVGCITKDDEIVYAGATNTATHTETLQDEESDWPEPTAIRWVWEGKAADGKDFHAEVDAPLGQRLDRIDVMAEVPGFFKAIAGSVAGTRPYIYQVYQQQQQQQTHSDDADCGHQYSPKEKLPLKLKIGDTESQEEGWMFSEATFIS